MVAAQDGLSARELLPGEGGGDAKVPDLIISADKAGIKLKEIAVIAQLRELKRLKADIAPGSVFRMLDKSAKVGANKWKTMAIIPPSSAPL